MQLDPVCIICSTKYGLENASCSDSLDNVNSVYMTHRRLCGRFLLLLLVSALARLIWSQFTVQEHISITELSRYHMWEVVFVLRHCSHRRKPCVICGQSPRAPKKRDFVMRLLVSLIVLCTPKTTWAHSWKSPFL